ncbi:nacht and ankyrin domain protein [Colletotrichum musicola]|uniref:Nacht and ankyrin domain protein n=1 Tax=Colletotrichum musicola TaxID=2175873 RepID=A0A8H6MLK2_9PEZI|nr:nacht and ankyrin domain protein [Colletotrichum musicola]
MLRAKPGTGKSVLMKEAVLSSTRDTSIVTLHHFFDNPHEGGHVDMSRKSSNACLRSLLGQLLRQVPIKPMDEIKKWNGSLPEERDLAFWTDSELQKTIKKVIGDNASQDRSFRCRIFIDALDESSNSHNGSSEKTEQAGSLTILRFIADLLSTALKDGVDVGAFVSRRYLPDFGAREPKAQQIDLAKHSRGAVQRYIERQLRDLDDPALQLGLLQELIHRSSDGFLWATVVTNQIQEAADWATAKELYDLAEGLPSDFDDMYEKALSHVHSARSPEALRIFQLVLCAGRSMTADQLRHALAFVEEFRHDSIEKWESSDEGLTRGTKFEKRIHRQSRGLIEIATLGDSTPGSDLETEEQVRFIHGSVAPFLRGPRGLGSRHAEPGTTEQHAHRLLFECCIRAFDACGLKGDDTVKFLDYAYEFWPVHAREAGDLLDAEDSAKLPSFMQKCKSKKWQRVLAQHIRCLKNSQVKEALLLEDESAMLVLLATMGCTTLLRRHLDTCAACRDACTKYDGKKDVFGSALSNSLIAKRTDTARFLLDVHCNGDVNAPSPDGRTLLYQACYFNHEEIVEFLLKRGADAALPSSRLYEYPLHAAIAKGYTRIIELLLRHLDEEEVEDLLKLPRETSGWTAIHFVMACGRPVSDRKRILDTMLQFAPRGVGLLEMRDDNGLTPAELARVIDEEQDLEEDDDGGPLWEKMDCLIEMLEEFEL